MIDINLRGVSGGETRRNWDRSPVLPCRSNRSLSHRPAKRGTVKMGIADLDGNRRKPGFGSDRAK